VGAQRIITWDGRDVLSLRVYFEGMGALQESILFAVVEGHVVHLEEDAVIDDALKARGWETSDHGGGFCRDSLIWENILYNRDGTVNPKPHLWPKARAHVHRPHSRLARLRSILRG